MKICIQIVAAYIALVATSISTPAEELRFEWLHYKVSYQPDAVVYNGNEEHTLVDLSPDSNKETIAVLTALDKVGCQGTSKQLVPKGPQDQQTILVDAVVGEIVQPKNPPAKDANPLVRHSLKVSHVSVRFPISVARTVLDEETGKIDVYIETHYGFSTLFPNGIAVAGKRLDLNRFIAKPKAHE
jgi:hypothetical protein